LSNLIAFVLLYYDTYNNAEEEDVWRTIIQEKQKTVVPNDRLLGDKTFTDCGVIAIAFGILYGGLLTKNSY